MRQLDRYILKQFFHSLFFAVIAFSIVFVIVDLVENLDRFIDRDVPILIVSQYYLFYIPYIVVLIIPIAMLLACLFSVGQLARNNELSAMQTSGISLYRIAIPLLILGFLVSGFMIFFAEYVMPPASESKFRIKREYVDKISDKIFAQNSNINILQSNWEKTYISHFDGPKNLAKDVTIQSYEAGKLKARTDAKRMVWADDHWVLENGIHREFIRGSELVEPFDSLPLKDFPFDPRDLQKVQKKPDEMNFSELKSFIRQVERNGGNVQSWLVDLHMKIAFPFASLVIVLFGIPLAAMQKRSGKALGFGISVGVCFLFFGLVKIFQTLGYNGILHPFIAAWASIIIIALLGVILLIKAKK